MARAFKLPHYSIVETNHIQAVKDGQIKAQYDMDENVKKVGMENGGVYFVDDVAKEVRYAKDGDKNHFYLHDSEDYVSDKPGTNKFKCTEPLYPKMLKLNPMDIFESNAVDAGDSTTTPVATDAKFGYPGPNGDIVLAKAAKTNAGITLKVVEVVTMRNGEPGIKFVVDSL